MTMTKLVFEDLVDRALKGLPGSSKNRLAICELVEHVEVMMATMDSPKAPVAKTEQVVKMVQVVQMILPAAKTVSNGILTLENHRLRQDLEEAAYYADRLRELLIGRVDEHY